MRFMMLMYPNIPADGWTPSADEIGEMTKYNQELSKAGILLTLDGLHGPDEAVHVKWDTGTSVVHDGPFAEVKEVVGGYWLIEVRSKDEAIEWAKRIPGLSQEQTVEIRQIQELEDFPEDVREAALQARV